MNFEELTSKFLIAVYLTPDQRILLSCTDGCYVLERKLRRWSIQRNYLAMEDYIPASSQRYICETVRRVHVSWASLRVEIHTVSYILILSQSSNVLQVLQTF